MILTIGCHHGGHAFILFLKHPLPKERISFQGSCSTAVYRRKSFAFHAQGAGREGTGNGEEGPEGAPREGGTEGGRAEA